MAGRKSVSPAVRRTMKAAGGNMAGVDSGGDEGNKGRTTMIPTRMRHLEVCCALFLWLLFLPVVLLSDHPTLNGIFLVLVCGLLLHGYSMRPYCTEFDEEEADEMMAMMSADSKPEPKNLAETSNKEFAESWKLVLLILTIASTLGATIAFSMGGGAVLRYWSSPVIDKCHVGDLVKLEGQYNGFRCTDGYLDTTHTRSFMTKGGIMIKTYAAYRIAAVYSGTEKPDVVKTIPVAWAVTKNEHLSRPLCQYEHGLCGQYATKEASPVDLAAYEKLKQTVHDDLVKMGAKEFAHSKIPIVMLTSFQDPLGKGVFFLVGSIFYSLVLCGLCCFSRHMWAESPSKQDSNKVFAGRPGYDPLNEVDGQGSMPE